jgi:hypothetical protein
MVLRGAGAKKQHVVPRGATKQHVTSFNLMQLFLYLLMVLRGAGAKKQHVVPRGAKKQHVVLCIR